MKLTPLTLLAMVLALAAGYGAYHLSSTPGVSSTGEEPIISTTGPGPTEGDDSEQGSARPDFSLSDVSGELRHISEWDGKVLAINFWATWCPPCIKEIPEFIELQHKYEDKGLQFIGIALQRPEEVREFMVEYGINYPILAGEMEVIKIAEAYGNDIGALPYTVIIDRAGNINFVKRGPLSGEKAEAVITNLL